MTNRFNVGSAVRNILGRMRESFRPAEPAGIALAIAFLAAAPFSLAAEPDATDPAVELASFKVAEGYEVNLFASERDGIVKPVQMRWDARGRLFVACIPSYPQPRPDERPDDRVVILEDTKGTGRADKSTLFAAGLSMPLGIEVGDGGAYVTDGNDIVHLKDTDGDGRADARRAVLRGFFSGDSHQTVNSFVWGPAGEMMMCQGLHAFSRVETPWGVERLEKAGAFRYWPKRGKLDPFLGWDRGPQNPWGVVFDDWGQPVMIAGNGQGIYYLLPNMIRTSHFLDPKQIGDTKGAKFCGVDIIGTRAMPDDAQGRMVAGSVMNNSVYWWTLEDAGSGFVAKNLPPLITSSSTSFRAVDVKVGPDGAIYVADWFNPIIGHYQASLHHPARDHGHGRIWRITAKGRPLVRQPELSRMTPAELLEQLRSPERWTRSQAKRLLADMPAENVAAPLADWVAKLDAKDARYEHLLTEAIGVYESHEIVEPGLLKKLLAAKDPRARAYATGVIGHWADRLDDPVALLRAAVADGHARVRLGAVVSASYASASPKQGADAMAAALVAADRPMDRFIGEALTQATAALKPHWKTALDAGTLAFEDKPDRLAALARADGTADVMTAVTTLIASGGLTGAARDSAMLLLAGAGGAVETGTVLTDAQVVANRPLLAKALDAVAANYRLHKQSPKLDAAAVLGTMVGEAGIGADPEVRRAAVTLAGAMKVEPLRGLIEKAASNYKAPAVQRAAFEALADLGGEKSKRMLARAINDVPDGFDRGPQANAVVSLARLDLAGAARVAADIMTHGNDPLPTKEIPMIVGGFLARQGGADALAAALETARPAKDAAKLALRAMSAAGRQDPKLWQVLSDAAGHAGQKVPYDAAFVAALAAEAAKSGDAAAGAAVFKGTVANCVACHSVASGGINAARIGPDLSPVGTALPADLIVESVLWPNRQIKEGYNAIVVETKDGDVLQGYRVNEDKTEFVLREPGADAVTRIPVADIKAKRDVGSIMPEGLTDGLTRKELVDLVRYLSELGRTPKQ